MRPVRMRITQVASFNKLHAVLAIFFIYMYISILKG